MSATFAATAKALSDSPELTAKVMAAGSPAERAEILKAAGVPVPTHDDVNSAFADLSDISGAGQTTTIATKAAPAAVPAVASAVAAS